ncbi:unnamed protein product, partial [Ectocarpus fasciculatus]
ITEYIIKCSEYSDWLPIGIFLIVPSTIRKYRWLFLYLIVFQALHLLGISLADNGVNNMWVYKLIGLSELFLISKLYLKFRLESIAFFSFLSVFAFYLVHSFLYIPIQDINSLALSVSTLFLITLSIQYLFQLYSSD